jgi:hypothetical protein
MNELEQFILGKPTKTVDREQLQAFAKKASAQFVNDGVPLVDAIGNIVKEADLNENHAKRLVEMANTATFLHMFKQGYDKNIDFELADADKLSLGQAVQKTSSEVPATPKGSSYVPGEEYTSLEEVFKSEDEEKQASGTWTSERSKDYRATVDRIKQASSDLDTLGTALNLQASAVKLAISDAVRDGASVTETVVLMKAAGVGQDAVALITEDLSTRVSDQLPTSPEFVPNEDHPLFKEAAKLADIQDKFFGVLDMASGVVTGTDPTDYPGLSSIIKNSLGRYITLED